MNNNELDKALLRLQKAVDQLDGALEKRRLIDGKVAKLEEEISRLGNDRNRLAQTLDGAEARSARLEEANREVSRRLIESMESIRAVLESQNM